MTSIRLQLLWRTIIISVLLVGSTSWFIYRDVALETQELFDAQLSRSARVLLSVAQTRNGLTSFSRIQEYLDEKGLAMMYIDFDAHTDEQATDTGHIYETKLAFQIWDQEGNLLVKSYNAPLHPISDRTSGYTDSEIDGASWRTFSLPSKNSDYRCITAERIDVRNDMIGKVYNDLFLMLIILVPTLSLMLYIAIDRGLRPLQHLAQQIDSRSGDNLDLVSTVTRSSEILTIRRAINRLLTRLRETLAREQRITSDAAHELRTPLAAIRLHAELAMDAGDDEQQQESLQKVIQGVDRSTHLVEQLLTLARLEPELLCRDFTTVDLSALIVEECSLLSPLALSKRIDISFLEDETIQLKGNESALRLLLRNLLKNAIAYTPQGGKVTIQLSRSDDNIRMTVSDTGPGIAKEDRARVMERFYRGENHDSEGCGIGLSIVDRVVNMHHGTLELSDNDNGTGLKVIILFQHDQGLQAHAIPTPTAETNV